MKSYLFLRCLNKAKKKEGKHTVRNRRKKKRKEKKEREKSERKRKDRRKRGNSVHDLSREYVSAFGREQR